MSGSVSSDNRAEPNLTPLLDMVFQLITFFMLVINFKSAALDLSLELPVVGSARPLENEGSEDTLVLNIDKEGKLLVYGHAVDMEQYLSNEARVSRMKLTGAAAKDPGAELTTTVIIRADRGVSFKDLNQVFVECQKRGFRKFSLKAFNFKESKS
jgi:biopolymer transport protein ExbD